MFVFVLIIVSDRTGSPHPLLFPQLKDDTCGGMSFGCRILWQQYALHRVRFVTSNLSWRSFGSVAFSTRFYFHLYLVNSIILVIQLCLMINQYYDNEFVQRFETFRINFSLIVDFTRTFTGSAQTPRSLIHGKLGTFYSFWETFGIEFKYI